MTHREIKLAVLMKECSLRDAHHSNHVRTPTVTQEMNEGNLESLGCGPSGWYYNVLMGKVNKYSVGLNILHKYICISVRAIHGAA